MLYACVHVLRSCPVVGHLFHFVVESLDINPTEEPALQACPPTGLHAYKCTHRCDAHTHTTNYAVWGTYTCSPLLRVHTKPVRRSGTSTSVYLRYIRTRHRCSLGPPRLLHPSSPTCSPATVEDTSHRAARDSGSPLRLPESRTPYPDTRSSDIPDIRHP